MVLPSPSWYVLPAVLLLVSCCEHQSSINCSPPVVCIKSLSTLVQILFFCTCFAQCMFLHTSQSNTHRLFSINNIDTIYLLGGGGAFPDKCYAQNGWVTVDIFALFVLGILIAWRMWFHSHSLETPTPFILQSVVPCFILDPFPMAPDTGLASLEPPPPAFHVQAITHRTCKHSEVITSRRR